MPTSNACWFRRTLMLAACAFAVRAALAQSAPEPATAPAADDASSYSIGLVFGAQLHGSGLDDSVSYEAVMRGFKDGMGGKALDDENQQRAMQLMRSGRLNLANRNHAAARDFLAKNGTLANITTTPSGLQYQVFAAGDAKAASPTTADRVTVNYRGRLLDGTEFDNSDSHPQAATFGLGGVIKGWREALPLMKPGARWRLFVPPELAYDLNSPPAIPPGSLLIFDVELLKVEPATPAPAGTGPPKPQRPATAAPRKAPVAKPEH